MIDKEKDKTPPLPGLIEPQFVQIACNDKTVYALDDSGQIWFRNCGSKYDENCWTKMTRIRNPEDD